MSTTAISLEERLADGYRAQAAGYEVALRLLEPSSSSSEALAMDAWLPDLQKTLNEVAAIDQAMAPDKAAWLQARRVPPDALRKELDTLAAQIRRLSSLIDARIAALTAERQMLVPKLDGHIQRTRMIQAYDQHGRPAKHQAGGVH